MHNNSYKLIIDFFKYTNYNVQDSCVFNAIFWLNYTSLMLQKTIAKLGDFMRKKNEII